MFDSVDADGSGVLEVAEMVFVPEEARPMMLVMYDKDGEWVCAINSAPCVF